MTDPTTLENQPIYETIERVFVRVLTAPQARNISLGLHGTPYWHTPAPVTEARESRLLAGPQ